MRLTAQTISPPGVILATALHTYYPEQIHCAQMGYLPRFLDHIIPKRIPTIFCTIVAVSDGTYHSDGMDPEFWLLDIGGQMGMGF